MGRVAEGLFHPEQVKMIQIPGPSSTGATGAAGGRSGGSSQQPRDGTSNARRGEAASARSGGGQLFVAKTSSAESWSKYGIREPRLLFVAGDHLVSERVSRTTGEHFGYVVDTTSHPATDKRPHPDKSKGYFRPEQVKIVEELSPVGTLSSNKTSSPLAKRKTPDTPAAVGGSDPDTDALLSRERKRTKIGEGIGSKDNPHRKMLNGRFQPPPQKQQQPETKPEPEPKRMSTAETKTNQAREKVVREESSRSITSTNRANSANSANSKPAAKGSVVEAKKKVSAPAKALAAKDGAVSKSSSECYVQAPPAMAAKARFPPGCVVIHTAPDGSTIAYTIRSVHLQLRSDQHISGLSNFDVLFKVGTEEDDQVLPEDSLMYARDCPILVKSDAVPHVQSQNGWVRGSVKSSIKLPGAVEEDYVVTIANGGTAHVSRDTIRYRDPTLSPLAAVLPVSVPAPFVAIDDSALSPSSAAETATTETATEDASKTSSSTATAPKKGTDASASVVCRIDVPDRIAFGVIRKILAPHVETMKRQLKVDVFTVGPDMPPPRDASVVRSFGDLFPRPQTSGIYSSCILISGTAKYTEKARKAIIHYLKEGMHGADIDKQNTLDKELEDGCRKAKAITKGDDKGRSREIEMEEDDGDDDGDGDDDEDEPDVIDQPPPQEESEDEPEEGIRRIEILDIGTFIGNGWAQVQQWQKKFKRRGVKISVRVREEVAYVSGPEDELEWVVREINKWQHSQRRDRESADVVFGGVVAG